MDKEKTNETPPHSDGVRQQIAENAARLDAIYESVEKTRTYFKASLIISIVVFVLPLIAAIILIPMFLDSYLGQFQGLL